MNSADRWLATASQSELQAQLVHQAKLLDRVRGGMAGVENLVDEGDRVVFGSTNDADLLRTLHADLDDHALEYTVFPAEGRDLYAELREIRQLVRNLLGAVATARDVFTQYAELHRAKKTPEGDLKAEHNEALVANMDAALAQASKTPSFNG